MKLTDADEDHQQPAPIQVRAQHLDRHIHAFRIGRSEQHADSHKHQVPTCAERLPLSHHRLVKLGFAGGPIQKFLIRPVPAQQVALADRRRPVPPADRGADDIAVNLPIVDGAWQVP